MKKTNLNRLCYFLAILAFMTLLGIFLVAFMVKVEIEPGLLPILIVLIGISGLIYVQFKIENANNLKQVS